MKRIRRLLHPQGANSFWTPFFAALVLIATGVVAFAIWPSKPQQISAAQRKVEQAEASPYERWLSQEVPYIITDQERTAFKNLTTDEERDTFIQQFWERRNPHPGNPKNEFKAEHYRRIAYANQHFASDRPGWETDRGYTYIAYGPPDEIAMNWYGPKPGPHVPYGIQVWTYRHVKGVGDNLSVQFMDTTGKGDYELPTDPNQQVRAPQRRATGATLAPTAKALPQQSSAAPPRQAAHAEISPYDRWLSEEVPYIITDQERTAFQKLATDEEREMFIQQFWERRNPHPGGSQNAFKEEHYRRIAYANEHFATGRPGWRTDRGRLYIIYGPPDEIESHPKPYPSEQWKYRSIEGLGNNVIFTFKDRTGKGDFILESPPWKTPAKKNSVS
jgi:GWxTD domain-containing protein